MENTRARVLTTANAAVNGDRNNQYGDPRQDFRRTATMWTALLGEKLGDHAIEAHEVALMMALLKVSRLAWSATKADSWVDLAGYAACGADCVDGLQGWPEVRTAPEPKVERGARHRAHHAEAIVGDLIVSSLSGARWRVVAVESQRKATISYLDGDGRHQNVPIDLDDDASEPWRLFTTTGPRVSGFLA